jgi:hypothetical protein
MPQVEAAACGVPVAAIDYSAMEDVVSTVKGYAITPCLEREMETNADRSHGNQQELVKIFLSFAKQPEAVKKKQMLETRKHCIQRYTWDNAAKAWEKYLDQVAPKDLAGQWDSPPMINPVPPECPKNLSHHQFTEWICTNLIQDQYQAFSFGMLSILRNLNLGANMSIGALAACSQESVFNEMSNIAQRRFQFDALRTGRAQSYPQRFIAEAHRRLKR